MATIRTSAAGLSRIERHEENRLVAYRDAVGVWTIGRGHTGSDAREGNAIDERRSMALFIADVADAEATIHRNLPAHVVEEIAQRQGAWDALVSATFNIGPKLFRNANGSRTGIWHALVERRWADVPAQLRRWDKGRVDGKVVQLRGLTTRRADEAALWASAWRDADPQQHGDAGIVPDEPIAPRPIVATKSVGGALVAGVGGAAAVGEQISEAAQQVGGFAMPGTWLWTAVGIAILVGVALTIYGRHHVRQRTGE